MRSSHPAVGAANRLDQIRRTDPDLRRHLLAVRTWALANGMAVDVDAMTAVLGTLARDEREGLAPQRWSKARVFDFVWGRCVLWCLQQGTRVPPGTPEALEQYWAHLADRRTFTADSDEPAVLVRALHACGGRTPARRRKRRSTGPQAQGPALRA
ncbi:MAG: hypothetical protein AB7O92_22375 [Acidimicrobiia bacterium]